MKEKKITDNIKKQVHDVVARTFVSINGDIDDNWGPEQIADWDSLNHLNLVMAIGEEFEISLEFEEVLSIEKIKDIYTIIKKRGIEWKILYS